MMLQSLCQRLGFLGLVWSISWALWHVSAFVRDWLRIKWGLIRSGIPAGPSRMETFSALPAHDNHRNILEWAEKYGSIFRLEFLHLHLVYVTDPVMVGEILNLSEVVDKPRFFYGAMDSLASPHGNPNLVSATTNSHWRLIRKGAMPAFSARSLKQNFPGMQDVLSKLVAALKGIPSDEVLDMDNIMSRESLDVIGQVGFGKDMGAIAALQEGKGTETAIDFVSLMLLEVEKYFFEPLRGLQVWREDVRQGKGYITKGHDLFKELLEDIKKRESELDPQTIAAHLLQIKDPKTGMQLPDEQLIPEIGIFFLAGIDTTAHSMAWTLYLLSQYPEAEAKVAAELAQHDLLATPAKPNPRPVQWDDLGKLTYLNAVIKEAVRSYPVAASGTSRVALQDIMLGGQYLVPKGTIVAVPLFAFLRSSRNWEEAGEFRPERFLDKDADIARKMGGVNKISPKTQGLPDDTAEPTSRSLFDSELLESDQGLDNDMLRNGNRVVKRYLPFSEGARSCAGMSLAKINMTATLATLVGNFTFRLADEMGGPEGVRNAECMAITLSTSTGMKMHCVPRV